MFPMIPFNGDQKPSLCYPLPRSVRRGILIVCLLCMAVGITGIICVSCTSKQNAIDRSPAEQTLNLRSGSMAPFMNDGIMIMAYQQQLHDELSDPIAAPEAEKQLEAARAQFIRRVEEGGFQEYSRFILADDSLQTVVLTLPDCQIRYEPASK